MQRFFSSGEQQFRSTALLALASLFATPASFQQETSVHVRTYLANREMRCGYLALNVSDVNGTRRDRGFLLASVGRLVVWCSVVMAASGVCAVCCVQLHLSTTLRGMLFFSDVKDQATAVWPEATER